LYLNKLSPANIFSGIGLSIERSFRIGDWVKVGDFDEGQVVNMNWRVTQIETRKGYILSIPNSTVSQSDIHNFSYPDNQYRLRLTVPIATNHDPRKVEEIFINAILSVEEVIKDFKPVIWLKDVQTDAGKEEWVAVYIIVFETKNYLLKFRTLKQVWDNIWVHLNNNGILPKLSHYQTEEETQKSNQSATFPIEIKLNKVFQSEDFCSYKEQVKNWPQTGRHILAQYDEESIIVYQAYRKEIGNFAASKGYFGGPFSYSRMSWIKPNFLWMMYRSGWATKPNKKLFHSQDEWKQAVKQSEVRLQWDPDHSPTGKKVERRAIQLGLRGKILEKYGTSPIEIIDISEFVSKQRENALTINKYSVLKNDDTLRYTIAIESLESSDNARQGL